MKKALVVVQDPASYTHIARLLESISCKATHATNIDQANSFQPEEFDLLICTYDVNGESGLSLISKAKTCPTVVIADAEDGKALLEAMRAGARDCLTRPVADQEAIAIFSAALGLTQSNNAADNQPRPQPVELDEDHKPVDGMIGTSEPMQTVYVRIRKAAPTRSTILIRGETGTGKELVARAIHEASDRSDKPFIAVNCAAIPETLIEAELFGHEKGAFTGAASKRSGLIEAAEGGTLFLDEIGELPSEAQARLLRFIQESEIRRIGSNDPQKVNVRLIAATHRDLKKLAASGGFRPDLYYRINVVRIDLPALKHRGSDLLEIAEYLLEKAALRHNKPGLHLLPDAIQAINNYNWPGNVRELENVIERAAIMSAGLEISRDCLEIESDLNEHQAFNAEILTPFTGNYLSLNQPAFAPQDNATSSSQPSRTQAPDPSEDLSLEDYFQRFVLENQETMNETELAKKLGISRKCLWERRQRFDIPRRSKSGSKSSGGSI